MASKRSRARGASKRPARPTPTEPVRPTADEFSLADAAVEESLLTGENAGLLEDYFGSESYAELRSLAHEAARRGRRGGPKVWILPGIMGSKIGRRQMMGLFEDVWWFDPIDIAAGRLADLALEPGAKAGDEKGFEALGVLLLGYLKLKLKLKIAGFDAEFHAFDWRKSLKQLGKELAAKLKAAGGERISLVAHSMGGLVSRSAMAQGATFQKLIMLGTPNHGSFAPVMAMRAAYPIVQKLGSLDLAHEPEWLAKNVFSTFPGLIEMFPSPKVWNELDLYDLDTWPADDLRPREEILAKVRAVQEMLPEEGEHLYLIAGVNQTTYVSLRKVADGGFEYLYSKEGDGTVPLAMCRLPAIAERTYYVEESHGSLPNNSTVARAVIDLLRDGKTEALPRTFTPAPDRAGPRAVSEASLRVDPFLEQRRASGGAVRLSQRERRHLLEEVASPVARTIPLPTTSGESTPVPAAGYSHRLEQVTVGRRRQHRLDVVLSLGSITEVDTRAIALGVFQDVAPGGAALALDQRLGGAIGELHQRRMLSGSVGEVFMMPTGRHPVSAELVAFVGLGPFDRFDGTVLETAAENILRTFVHTWVEDFATVVVGSGSGESPAAALRSLLVGFVRALLDADRDHHFRRVVICERNPERYEQIKAELYRLASTSLLEGVELTFDERRLPDPPAFGPVERGAARRKEDPAYLIVRQEAAREGGKRIEVRSSLLTAGGKATVVTGVRSVETAVLRREIQAVLDTGDADFAATGQALAVRLLDEAVLTLLPHQRDRHLVVLHDAPMSRIPWEALALGEGEGETVWYPAAEKGLSHRYAADNLSVAKWLEERRLGETLEVLLVVNPTRDLEGAEREGRRVRQLFGDKPGFRLRELVGDAATREAVLAEMGSGKYDAVHYAGHAFFDAANPGQSGLLCAGEVPLTGADLAGIGKLPALVFFNACESMRVRGRKREAKPRKEHLEESIGLAEAFLRGGVANLLGTYWPVGDDPATTFAESFYTDVVRGKTLGDAVTAARAKVRALDSNDWANYVLYGDADFVLKASR